MNCFYQRADTKPEVQLRRPVMVADLISVNSLEAHLMELWLKDRIEMIEHNKQEPGVTVN